jgi:hypothetical protein
MVRRKNTKNTFLLEKTAQVFALNELKILLFNLQFASHVCNKLWLDVIKNKIK